MEKVLFIVVYFFLVKSSFAVVYNSIDPDIAYLNSADNLVQGSKTYTLKLDGGGYTPVIWPTNNSDKWLRMRTHSTPAGEIKDRCEYIINQGLTSSSLYYVGFKIYLPGQFSPQGQLKDPADPNDENEWFMFTQFRQNGGPGTQSPALSFGI